MAVVAELTFQISPAARKWPMFVMHEPRKTSSIFVFATSVSFFTSSGSFGQARMGSWISARSMSITAAYSALLSARSSAGFASQASTASTRFASVAAS